MTALSPSADPAGMQMSEKLDGFLAAWDGKRLTSASGAPGSGMPRSNHRPPSVHSSRSLTSG